MRELLRFVPLRRGPQRHDDMQALAPVVRTNDFSPALPRRSRTSTAAATTRAQATSARGPGRTPDIARVRIGRGRSPGMKLQRVELHEIEHGVGIIDIYVVAVLPLSSLIATVSTCFSPDVRCFWKKHSPEIPAGQRITDKGRPLMPASSRGSTCR
jgi:hypothetical protein